jgi:transcriptional regulator with XRE-family HTH domain
MIDEFGLNERLRILRESLNLGRQPFCEKIGLKRQDLQNIELKRQRAPSWIIEKIAEIYPEYGYWLGTGKELPEAGQISPTTKAIQESMNLKAA